MKEKKHNSTYPSYEKNARIHLKTKKLFTAGDFELPVKKGEIYTCCGMIIDTDSKIQATDNIKSVSCKDCLKRTRNLY